MSSIIYKGFDQNLKCGGFQYEIGKTYNRDKTGLIEEDEYPLNVFGYYSPSSSRYAEVELSNKCINFDNDLKTISEQITINTELSVYSLIQRSIEWIKSKETNIIIVSKNYDIASSSNDYSAVITSGFLGAGATSGEYSVATASGDRSTITISGDCSAAIAYNIHNTIMVSGDCSAAITMGECSTITVSGCNSIGIAYGMHSTITVSGNCSTAIALSKHSIVCGTGFRNKVQAIDGCTLFLVARDPKTNIITHVFSGIVGEDGIKPMTFYTLDKNGQLIETD